MLKLSFIIIILSTVLSAKTKVIESNNDYILFSYSTEFQGFTEVRTADNFVTYTPKIKEAYLNGGVAGTPMKFTHYELIAVPDESKFKVELISKPQVDEINALMTPVRDVLSNDNLQSGYRIGESYFSYSYDNPFKFEYIGIVGNHKVIRASFDVAYYDNNLSSIIIPKEFVVKVSYNSKVNISKNSKTKSHFGNFLNRSIADNWNLTLQDKRKNKFLADEKIYSDGEWFKIKIDKDGVYKLTQSQLTSFGINIPKDKINTIKIIGNGGHPLSELPSIGKNNKFNEQEIIVNTTQNGDLSDIIFYASDTRGFEYVNGGFQRYLNWYSDNNYYLLTWGGDEGLRAKESDIIGEVVNKPTTYYHKIYNEDELFNPYGAGGGRQYLGKPFTNTMITNVLQNLDRSQKVYYKVSIAHTASTNANVEVSENGIKLSPSIYLASSAGYTIGDIEWKTYGIDGNKISSDNRSKLELKYNGDGINSGYLDYYEIHYPREFLAISNELEFWSDPKMSGITEYNIRNFSSSSKYAFDITDLSNPKLIKNYANDLDKIIFKSIIETNKPRRYYLTSDLKSVSSIEKITMNNLRGTKFNKDVILITDEGLLSSANKFKEYREANSNFKIGVFTTQDIYNEFAAGLPDVVALRDFISNAFSNWETQPQYVVLWGDGHSDYRNITYKAKNFAPPFLSIDTTFLSETNSTSYDDFYVRVNGDDAQIDLSIGRIPVKSNEEGLDFINKLDTYEHKSDIGNWRERITLVADDSKGGDTQPPDGNDHVEASEELANLGVMADFLVDKIYLPEFETIYTANGRRKPDANNAIISALRDKGTAIINWTGHGNPTVWSHESVFAQNTSIKELNNINRLTFFCAATCEFGRYDQTTGVTAAEELLFSSKGGAIGVFAATRLVFASSNAALNELFFDHLLSKDSVSNKYKTLGNVLFDVKQIRNLSNDEKYLLLGDPTMKLILPENNVVFEEINGIRLDKNNDMIDLEGLSQITLKGKITNPQNDIISNFNGNILFTIFDGDEAISINEIGVTYKFSKYGGILSNSSFKVENGHFEANLYLPKDISYSQNNGRLFAYAVTSDNLQDAKGNYNKFYVSGVGENNNNDNQGPEINLFVDSRAFQNGDVVSSQPNLIVDLEDPIGINSTGNGIGHRIEAWLNDGAKSIDLSNSYATSLDNSKIGTSQAILKNVKVGLNKVTVRAWDIFNNFSIKTAYFNIKGDANDLWLGDIKNYPNPFEFQTAIQFRHNLEIPFDANINIYNINGKLVKSISQTLYNKYADEVNWDGKDEDGVPIISGSYYIQVNLVNKQNEKITKSGILSLKVK